jgi:hypothetical protein
MTHQYEPRLHLTGCWRNDTPPDDVLRAAASLLEQGYHPGTYVLKLSAAAFRRLLG